MEIVTKNKTGVGCLYELCAKRGYGEPEFQEMALSSTMTAVTVVIGENKYGCGSGLDYMSACELASISTLQGWIPNFDPKDLSQRTLQLPTKVVTVSTSIGSNAGLNAPKAETATLVPDTTNPHNGSTLLHIFGNSLCGDNPVRPVYTVLPGPPGVFIATAAVTLSEGKTFEAKGEAPTKVIAKREASWNVLRMLYPNCETVDEMEAIIETQRMDKRKSKKMKRMSIYGCDKLVNPDVSYPCYLKPSIVSGKLVAVPTSPGRIEGESVVSVPVAAKAPSSSSVPKEAEIASVKTTVVAAQNIPDGDTTGSLKTNVNIAILSVLKCLQCSDHRDAVHYKLATKPDERSIIAFLSMADGDKDDCCPKKVTLAAKPGGDEVPLGYCWSKMPLSWTVLAIKRVTVNSNPDWITCEKDGVETVGGVILTMGINRGGYRCLNMDALVVRPEHRGSGVGTVLLSVAIATAQTMDVSGRWTGLINRFSRKALGSQQPGSGGARELVTVTLEREAMARVVGRLEGDAAAGGGAVEIKLEKNVELESSSNSSNAWSTAFEHAKRTEAEGAAHFTDLAVSRTDGGEEELGAFSQPSGLAKFYDEQRGIGVGGKRPPDKTPMPMKADANRKAAIVQSWRGGGEALGEELQEGGKRSLSQLGVGAGVVGSAAEEESGGSLSKKPRE